MNDTQLHFPKEWSEWNVALAHDWLITTRGGEAVLEILCRGFPGAPIHTLLYDPANSHPTFAQHPLRTSWLQRLPAVTRYYRHCLPFFPGAVERMQVDDCDLMISTSHCVAKGIQTPSNTRHICYCFTPMRYAWVFYEEYFGRNPASKLVLKPLLAYLRRWDLRTLDRVDRFIAISEHIQRRIKDCYNRDADVVYPPVNTAFYNPDGRKRDSYDLIVSALVPYKRVDIAIRAYTRMNWPLKVIGVGSGVEKLKAIAGPSIEFLGWETNEAVREHYRSCRFLVFPGEEDFGLVPLEAQACGCAVIAYGVGGAVETVIDGESGVHFSPQTEAALIAAVEGAAARDWDPGAARVNAERFTVQNFITALAAKLA